MLYGLDGIGAGATEVVVVEGEMDKLSLDEAGLQHVVSVSGPGQFHDSTRFTRFPDSIGSVGGG